MRAPRGQRRMQQLRQSVAHEAARLMSEQGIRDYRQAKHKAAERLGVQDEKALPRNIEIEEALRTQQRLFDRDGHAALLASRRRAAVDAMRFFERFEPRLVGAVLEGTADRHSAVCLHLFSDNPLELDGFLAEQGIPYRMQSRRLRIQRNLWHEYPVYLFTAGETPVDITLLPRDAVRQAPIDRSGARPLARASLPALLQLMDEERDAPAAPD